MKTERMEELYREIANILNNMVPEEWQKIHVYAEVREGYASVFFYYYPIGVNTPMYSLDITDRFIVNDEYFSGLDHQLYDAFRKLLSEFKLQEQQAWTNLTLTLYSDGNFKINYEYDDVAQISPVEKKEKWKIKYLNL
ncbi:immunity protein YezG family protein [Anaerosinus gibii]|uniref:DUF600 family protein n=1 Tax=Selenobaculum gibii TaxID=3054208 RepID=A0A9Y2AHF8_9FIRM|nr:immunity protein YezG family protein [Selenobaculum gbiensis]WIW70884.1 DUF600 family protein [Selenobaculum gbiensis]